MRILVVEDDQLLNKTLSYNLSAVGYSVDGAMSKAVAIRFLEKQDYDLIVLDVNLPDGNGFDICHEVKERRPDTAVIFLTANDMESDMIGGLDVPTSGKVIVDGRELSTLKDEQLTIFRRRKIGFIFQNYNLVPVLNVYENIVLPVELDGNKVDKKFMKEVVQMLGLEDKLNNMPNNLSGGQQQRVAIARALVSKPAIVLADEPTGNLDSKTSADVLGLLKTTSQKFHQTLVMITHNNEIAQLADRIIRIEDGKIVQ